VEPGNFSAIGMLLADARIDTSKTFVSILDDRSVPSMAELFAAMEKEAAAALVTEFGTKDIFFEHYATVANLTKVSTISLAMRGRGMADNFANGRIWTSVISAVFGRLKAWRTTDAISSG
jgi:N-methylhydantoinase A/oxoprolinase/acetone carboxylase beta subunit